MTDKNHDPDAKRKNNWKQRLLSKTEDLLINADKVTCLFCNYEKDHSTKEGSRQFLDHCNSSRHIYLKKLKKEFDYRFANREMNSDMMQEELCKFLINCNIPLSIVDSPFSEHFLLYSDLI